MQRLLNQTGVLPASASEVARRVERGYSGRLRCDGKPDEEVTRLKTSGGRGSVEASEVAELALLHPSNSADRITPQLGDMGLHETKYAL